MSQEESRNSIEEDRKLIGRCSVFESLCSLQCIHCGLLLESEFLSPALLSLFLAFPPNRKAETKSDFSGTSIANYSCQVHLNMQTQAGMSFCFILNLLGFIVNNN